MFGVVLWSDRADSKAVIWCEDQGNLAYFTNEGAELERGPALEAGDLVQFRLEENAPERRVESISLVADNSFVGLPDALKSTARGTATHRSSRNRLDGPARAIPDCGAEIIPFARPAA